ncbi:neogenin-like [Gigantopelta aegis]|uniref:neogenin-like n=1 Tax=Gigantopelta aegis TaxID=1735272 RepID=UPI001B88D8AC|nr:neogenin-like [Gigantopelta aegis]
MTAKGAGPYSKWTVATTDKIAMTPPESPTSIQITSTSNSIQVWWTPPRDIGVPVNGYILGYGRYIPEVFRTILGPATHRYNITNLRHKSLYIISVRAFNGIGESSPKFLVGETKEDLKATFPLKAPINVKATTLSHNEIALGWFDPSLGKLQKRVDSRYYMLRYSAVSNDVYKFVNATRSPFVVGDLMVFTKYEFSVRAVRGDDQSGWSLPQFNKTSPTVPLDAPRELTVLMDSKSPSTLTISWLPPQTPNGIIEEYFLYKTSDPSLELKYWVVETTPGTKLTKTINNVTPHTILHFQVQARNVAGYGPLSEVVIYSPVTDSAAAPSNVNVSALNGNRSTSIEVSWSMPEKPTVEITGYIVYYRVQGSGEDYEDDADDLSWMVHDERGLSTVILDLQHNLTYEFKVGARYSGGFGPVSEVVVYTTSAKDDEMGIAEYTDHYEDNGDDEEGPRNDVPLPPSEITAEGATNSIRLAWVAPSVNKSATVEFYRLGYGELFPDSSQVDVNATESVYVIEDLKPETTYIVSVRAVNGEGSSRPVMTTVTTTS